MSKKHRKSKSLRKPLFVHWFSKVRACEICSNLQIRDQNIVSKIVLNPVSVFYSMLPHFCSTLGVILDHFSRLVPTLDNFWKTLVIVWLQLGSLGCSFGRLGLPFCSHKSTLIGFWSISTSEFEKDRQILVNLVTFLVCRLQPSSNYLLKCKLWPLFQEMQNQI